MSILAATYQRTTSASLSAGAPHVVDFESALTTANWPTPALPDDTATIPTPNTGSFTVGITVYLHSGAGNVTANVIPAGGGTPVFTHAQAITGTTFFSVFTGAPVALTGDYQLEITADVSATLGGGSGEHIDLAFSGNDGLSPGVALYDNASDEVWRKTDGFI